MTLTEQLTKKEFNDGRCLWEESIYTITLRDYMEEQISNYKNRVFYSNTVTTEGTLKLVKNHNIYRHISDFYTDFNEAFYSMYANLLIKENEKNGK